MLTWNKCQKVLKQNNLRTASLDSEPVAEDCHVSRIPVIRTSIAGSLVTSSKYQGLPAVIQNLPASAGDPRDSGSIPGPGRIPWRRKW